MPVYAKDPGPSADDFIQSNATILSASIALNSGDREALLVLLSSGSGKGLAVDDLDLSGAGAAKLAAALGSSRPVRATSTSIKYEITADGQTDYIYTVKENGVWKLDV